MSSTPTTGFTPSAAANKKKAGYNNGLKKRGGHSTKQDPSKVDTSGERVIDPRQVVRTTIVVVAGYIALYPWDGCMVFCSTTTTTAGAP